MTALHDLTGEYLELSRNEDLPIDAIYDTLQAIGEEIKVKAVSLVRWSQDIDGDIDKIDNEIKRLKAKKDSLTERRDGLSEYIKANMKAADIKSIKCPFFTISYVAGPDIVEIIDETLIPDEYVTVETTISADKNLIKKALKEGVEVAGCKLGTGKSSLRIK
jgi:hypothetical protein